MRKTAKAMPPYVQPDFRNPDAPGVTIITVPNGNPMDLTYPLPVYEQPDYRVALGVTTTVPFVQVAH